MDLASYRLLAQLSAGTDGVAYRAEAPGGVPVELHLLAGARADPLRWPILERRLRLCGLLDHPGARKVLHFSTKDDPPWVVFESADGQALDKTLRVPVDLEKALALTAALAECLAAAHRLGLVHGRLTPGSVISRPSGVLQIDFTGLRTGSTVDRDAPSDPTADVKSLGMILRWLLTGRLPGEAELALEGFPAEARRFLEDLRATDPAGGTSIREVVERIRRLNDSLSSTRRVGEEGPTATSLADNNDAKSLLERGRLGRYRLHEQIGQGGMGTVFRAEDLLDGRIVALKVLRTDQAANPITLKRFRKEARMLTEINNPHVTNLLDVNEDDGVHYLVLEFVRGQSLEQVLEERGRFPEREALEIVADVARGLAAAHARGVVHRDVKPGNILLSAACEVRRAELKTIQSEDGAVLELRTPHAARRTAKLSDFGLARHVVQTESMEVTRAGVILGTPLYMSPEQCAGGVLDTRSDVYSMGATLFHLLAGRPPFQAAGMVELFALHANQAPPPLRSLNSELSEDVGRVVERALAKTPADRHPDAAAFLRELERMLRGEPADLALHPRRPDAGPRRVLRYEFTWDLESPPAQLWPHVSNTERLNRAAGLTAPRYTIAPPKEDDTQRLSSADVPIGARTRRFAEMRAAGVPVAWEEHPFEWIEGRRFGVLREFTRGPFRWYTSVVELAPRGPGTRLTQRIDIEPNGLLGRTIAAFEIGLRTRRNLGRVYQRIDAALVGKLAETGSTPPDPFEETAGLGRARREQLDLIADELLRRGVHSETLLRLLAYVAEASSQDVARIRPIALARALGLDADAVVTACLHGVRAGLFLLLWDVLCPSCRIPTAVKDTLKMLREHEHCAACNLNFELDFANSVELIFRAHPEIRDCELGTFCVGGPAHSPHVVAQARVAQGERLELDLALAEGAYRVRGPQLPFVINVLVRANGATPRLDLNLSHPPESSSPHLLRSGGQVFALSHDYSGEVLVRIERSAPRDDALTAARASALDLFRELFPDEILSPGRLVTVATTTLLVTALDDADALYRRLGDARAFAVVHEQFRLLRERIRAEGGALVKTVGEGIVAAFPDALSAVRVALGIGEVLSQSALTRGLRLRAGVHRGPMMAATVNDQLDYFGTTVRQALALPETARAGEVVLTQAVAGDPAVAELIAARGGGELFTADLPEAAESVLLRVEIGMSVT